MKKIKLQEEPKTIQINQNAEFVGIGTKKGNYILDVNNEKVVADFDMKNVIYFSFFQRNEIVFVFSTSGFKILKFDKISNSYQELESLNQNLIGESFPSTNGKYLVCRNENSPFSIKIFNIDDYNFEDTKVKEDIENKSSFKTMNFNNFVLHTYVALDNNILLVSLHTGNITSSSILHIVNLETCEIIKTLTSGYHPYSCLTDDGKYLIENNENIKIVRLDTKDDNVNNFICFERKDSMGQDIGKEIPYFCYTKDKFFVLQNGINLKTFDFETFSCEFEILFNNKIRDIQVFTSYGSDTSESNELRTFIYGTNIRDLSSIIELDTKIQRNLNIKRTNITSEGYFTMIDNVDNSIIINNILNYIE